MRHVTFIAGILLGLSFASCSMFQTPPASPLEEGGTKTSSKQVLPEQDGESVKGNPGGPLGTSSLSSTLGLMPSDTAGILTMPHELQDSSVDPEDLPVQTGPLPGDLRSGLRTPSLPDVLPLTLDGKINPSSISSPASESSH